jgi:hypothetical protein
VLSALPPSRNPNRSVSTRSAFRESLAEKEAASEQLDGWLKTLVRDGNEMCRKGTGKWAFRCSLLANLNCLRSTHVPLPNHIKCTGCCSTSAFHSTALRYSSLSLALTSDCLFCFVCWPNRHLLPTTILFSLQPQSGSICKPASEVSRQWRRRLFSRCVVCRKWISRCSLKSFTQTTNAPF